MLRQAQILAKVNDWTVPVATELCHNLRVQLNSESGDYKLKAEKTVNNVAADKVSRMVKPGCTVESPLLFIS